MKFYISLLSIVFIFLGCSSKQYYEPQDVTYLFPIEQHTTNSYIKDVEQTGATLDNNSIIDNIGISKFKIPNGYRFLNKSQNHILLTNEHYQLHVLDTNETFTFKTNIIAATLKDNLLALVFTNNSIGLYDIVKKEFKLKEYFQPSVLNDARIAMPMFLDDLILYPTLDGKIVVVNKKLNTITKKINIDVKDDIKNIIFLNAIDNILVVATPNKIITLGDGNFHNKEFFIQNMLVSGKYIYVAALDGTVYKFDTSLKVIAKNKFKFAKLQAIAKSDKFVYLIETQGYLLKLDDKLNLKATYSFIFENDERVFVNKNKIYYDNKLLILP